MEENPAPAGDSADAPSGASALSTADEFNSRVERILVLIEEKPELEKRLLAEIYVQMSEASTFFREMQQDFANLGPGGILSMLRGGGKKKQNDRP